MSIKDVIFAGRPVKPCDHCGAKDGYTAKGDCNKCGAYLGDGVALVGAPEPPGLTEEIAAAIRSGKLTKKPPPKH